MRRAKVHSAGWFQSAGIGTDSPYSTDGYWRKARWAKTAVMRAAAKVSTIRGSAALRSVFMAGCRPRTWLWVRRRRGFTVRSSQFLVHSCLGLVSGARQDGGAMTPAQKVDQD